MVLLIDTHLCNTVCMGHGHWSTVAPFLVMTNFFPEMLPYRAVTLAGRGSLAAYINH